MKVRNLPIHGALVHIVLKNNSTANDIIFGDSGAGKSESLDAFRTLAKDYLKSFKIILIIWGAWKLNMTKSFPQERKSEPLFSWMTWRKYTHLLQWIDSFLWIQTKLIPARLTPIAEIPRYYLWIWGRKYLSANNYESPKAKIRLFDQQSEAQEVFISGKRMAKGNTSESGTIQRFLQIHFAPFRMRVMWESYQ